MVIPIDAANVADFEQVRDWLSEPNRTRVLITGGPDRFGVFGEPHQHLPDGALISSSVWEQTYYLHDENDNEYARRIWITACPGHMTSFEVEEGTSSRDAIYMLAMVFIHLVMKDPSLMPQDEAVPDWLCEPEKAALRALEMFEQMVGET